MPPGAHAALRVAESQPYGVSVLGPDGERLSANPSSEREWVDARGQQWVLKNRDPDPRHIKALCSRTDVTFACIGDEDDIRGWLTDPEEKRQAWATLQPRTWQAVEGDYTARVTEWREAEGDRLIVMLEQFCS